MTEETMDEIEWTEEERAALDALPRERQPSDLLEERVVSSLRARGMLGEARRAAAPTAASDGEPGSAARRSPPRRGVPVRAAVAAGFALLVIGGVGGHALGARATTEAFLAVREQDAALQVQQAGTALVQALVRLEEMEAGEERVGQGTEAAATTLHAAARIMARIDPEDPLMQVLARLLEERTMPAPPRGDFQQTIWF